MRPFLCLTLFLASFAPSALAQAVISGRIQGERFPGSGDILYHGAILCFGSPTGPGTEAKGFRSWETAPASWYRLSGPAANYTLLFTQPAGHFRPITLNNLFTSPGETLDPLRAETPGHGFQAWWHPSDDPVRACYRAGVGSTGLTAHGLWMAVATDDRNLLRNGSLESGTLKPDGVGQPDHWTPFAIDPGTTHLYLLEEPDKTNRIARILGGGGTGKTVDGGWVQRVTDLDRLQTYRLTAQLRASWPADAEHQGFVGWDPTGQTADPKAASMQWSPAWPGYHGHFLSYTSDPLRPAINAISVWLRARTTFTGDPHAPFKADFDELALRRVRTEPPTAR